MESSFSIIFGLVALFSYLNYKFLKLPYTIGVLIISIGFVSLLYATQDVMPDAFNYFCDVVVDADFENLLFNGLLSFLLFAGAMHINIKELATQRWSVLLFASIGVVISTTLVGVIVYGIGQLIGAEIPIIYALLFGALISPTDPIAVLSILKNSNVSKSLQLKIEGESLFNDGVGVVVFSALLLLLPVMSPASELSISEEIGLLFLEEAIGGLVYGAILGGLGYLIIKSVLENAQLAVLISLAVVMTGYAVANLLHVSGPLAMVVCGLIIGNGLDINNHEKTEGHKLLNEIWEVLDEVLNGVLFVLIGLALHVIPFESTFFIMGLIAIVITLLARYFSIFSLYSLVRTKGEKFGPTIKILTWGGLRGGISLALALSLGHSIHGQHIILMTYVVVVFSIVVQGLTIGKLVDRLK